LPAYNPPRSASSPSPAGAQGCASLVISVATDHSAYLRGSPVAVTVTLSNPSDAPCSSACPPSYWAQAVIVGYNQNGLRGHGVLGCGGALAAHASFSEHYLWCQVFGQDSAPSNSCAGAAPPDVPSGTYQVQAYVNFTTEGDQLAGSFDISIL